MEKISNTNNYYLSIDGIEHTPIRLNSFQHENIKLTNLYCLLMFTSQFNNRKALMRYLKDLELIPEDYVGDYIAIVDRHTDDIKKEYYKDTHLRIFYQRDIGYFNEEIIADFITKNLGDPKFDELVEPDWLVKKFCVLNDIDKEMVKQNTYQGIKCSNNN